MFGLGRKWPRRTAQMAAAGMLAASGSMFFASTAIPAYGAAAVTPTPINGSCNGILPTPGSENTLKKVLSVDSNGTPTYQISYPLDPADIGKTFTVNDCPIIGGDVKNAQLYQFSFVPNNANFEVTFSIPVPAGTPSGTSVCNYAKTTGPPSSSQSSNRKAGPACFTVGGNLRIEKHETGSNSLLAGAQFSVACPSPTTTVPEVAVNGLVNAGGNPVSASYNNGTHQYEVSGFANPGFIAIWGPSGLSCTVTETAAPPGHVLASPASRTYTIPVGAVQDVRVWNNDVAAPSLHVVKSSTPADGSTVTAGTTITYSLDYYNNGNVDVANATLTDDVPANTTLVAGSITAGGTENAGTITWSNKAVAAGTSAANPAGTVSFSVTVNAGVAAGTTIDNTGHIGAAGITTVDSNTTHHHVALISTLKSSNPASGTAANPAAVKPGDSITYTVSVTNPGAVAALVNISDSVPTHTTLVAGSDTPAATTIVGGTLTWTGVSVPANGSTSVSFQVTVDAGTANGTDIRNTATVNGSNTNTTFHQVQLPHFKSSKSAVPASGTTVAPGDDITYTIHVENDGLANGSTKVTDTIPTGTSYKANSIDNGGSIVAGVATWDPVALNKGASVDLHFTVTVNAGAANGDTIDNVATVAGASTNAVQHTVSFAHFTYSKSASPNSGSNVAPGDPITYTIHVKNDGGKAGAVDVVDAVPANTTYQANSADNGGVFAAGSVTWSAVALNAGDSIDLTFKVTVNAAAANGTVITNSATVNGNRTNVVNHTVVVVPPPPPPPNETPATVAFTTTCTGIDTVFTTASLHTTVFTVTTPLGATDTVNGSDSRSYDADAGHAHLSVLFDGLTQSFDWTEPAGCQQPGQADPQVSEANHCKSGMNLTLSNMNGTADTTFTVTDPDGNTQQVAVRAGQLKKLSFDVTEDTTGTLSVSAPGLANQNFTYDKNCATVLGVKHTRKPVVKGEHAQLPFTGFDTRRYLLDGAALFFLGAVLCMLGARRKNEDYVY